MTEHIHSDLLYLPGDPGFYETLGCSLPVGHEQFRDHHNGEVAYIVRHDLGGVMEAVDIKTATEYLHGGEYDLVEEQNEILEQEYFVNCPEWMR